MIGKITKLQDCKIGKLISIFFLVIATYSFSQNNDNISLQGKSVMYNLGGKLFYGRALNKQVVSEKTIETNDSSAAMKVRSQDAFGNKEKMNAMTTDLYIIQENEEEMKVRTKDVFGEKENLKPITEPNLSTIETKEAKMKIRSKDAFGNYVYENINPLAEQKVVLMDENETVMRITVTDAFGNFSFANLNPEGNYRVQLQMESNPNLPKDDLIYFANNNNEVLEAFKINEKGKFGYSLLSGELTKMKLMEAVEVKMEK